MSLRRVFQDAWTVASKDVSELFRNRAMLIGLAAGPFFMILLLGFVFPNIGGLTDVPFGIAIEDSPEVGDSEAPLFVAKLEEANALTNGFVFRHYGSADEARAAVEAKKLRGFLLVPEDFTNQRRHGGVQTEVQIYFEQSNPNMARVVVAMADALVRRVSQEEGMENVRAMSHLGSSEASRALVNPYSTETRALTNASPTYAQFLVPGLIMMHMMSAVVLGLPNGVRRERERGTLDAILVSPIGRASFLIGKVMATTVRAATQSAMMIALAILFFGIHFAGSWLLVIGLAALCLFAFAGLGVMMVVLRFREVEQSAGINLMVVMPMLLLAGVMFPIEQLPKLMQYLSYVIPLTYGVAAMRRVIIVGAGLEAIIPEVLVLVVFGIVGLAIAIPMFQKAVRRDPQ